MSGVCVIAPAMCGGWGRAGGLRRSTGCREDADIGQASEHGETRANRSRALYTSAVRYNQYGFVNCFGADVLVRMFWCGDGGTC
eukprot:825619-Prymnesium_polylepis.2